MGKKKLKRKKAKKNLGFKNYKFNSISIAVNIVIIIIMMIILSIIYIYADNSLKELQTKTIHEFIVKTPDFKTNIDNKRYDLILSHLNQSLPDNLKIAYLLITDKENQKQIYSSNPYIQTKYIAGIDGMPKLAVEYTEAFNKSKYMNIIFPYGAHYEICLALDRDISYSNIIFVKSNNLNYFVAFIFFIILVFSFLLSRSISKPLSDVNKVVSQISKGDLSGRLENTTYYEINELIDSYNQMADTMQQMYSTLEKQVQDRTEELKNAYKELQSTQAIMVHSEKMKSLGELVAGIMHEINNPINFIYGNMTHLNNYSNDLMEIIEAYSKHDDNLTPENLKEINDLKNTIDYEFLKTDLPDLIKSCREGADRAKNIIQDLKSFSRMEELSVTDIDIPHEIDTVLNILHNKIKNKATIHKEYMENIPRIEAFGGQLNQVFMNIIDNASGAIKETGDIWIRINSDKSKKNLIIEIEDNGVGMDEETQRKVFNPFFTTKPVGQGTGLGMSISYKIIKNHQGDIKVESKKGQGSKFIIRLPMTINMEELNTEIQSKGKI
ncbi:HAMP domain-containing protein [bacterium]|nr:HAMP domain-containing protein [bacterium]